ncbi:UDP-glucose/GDP-mannose dehydrogenase family protein [Solitalea sp. MAHUQ-68]|uniref:UDP-glucose 6-dehydrogenase n=1 Tax=Solitalea agri TaxID=2953739 RepID=A0A9X2JFC0_9SPHI|nr:UDP-glucose/GDP-mannose dehydrogenase family protein [Solitalea agri]MCO4293246.1 UDP-glucose/GDP-mannose dehydrogenase family protein [Solitalea agri]
MKIAVIGTGYVGLVTGTCLAETGNNVICVDIDANKVGKMQESIVPFYEPDLESLFKRNIHNGTLSFTTNLEEAVNESLIIILALPTPPSEDGSADLSYVLNTAEAIGKLMTSYKIIVNKSTVPVGTADKVRETVANYTKHNFDVVSNPEFLREGVAVNDFMKPSRVIVGTRSEKVKKIFSELYAPYMRQGERLIFMDERSAELTKYAANAFLATKISFMNEMAGLCEILGANVEEIRRGIGMDDRIGKQFLYAGVGYGGSCFPKDVQALAKTAIEIGGDFRIVDAVMKTNYAQREKFLDKIINYFGANLKGKKLAFWGLAFKPETDDLREAPALYLIEELLKEGVEIVTYDPVAMENTKKQLGDKIGYAKNQYECLEKADALVIVTEWKNFRNPDFDQIAEKLNDKVIFDGRNLYNLERMQELGFYYNSIGRQLVQPKTSN